MQLNTAKQKLLAGQPAYGYSLGLGSPLVAELLARTRDRLPAPGDAARLLGPRRRHRRP